MNTPPSPPPSMPASPSPSLHAPLPPSFPPSISSSHKSPYHAITSFLWRLPFKDAIAVSRKMAGHLLVRPTPPPLPPPTKRTRLCVHSPRFRPESHTSTKGTYSSRSRKLTTLPPSSPPPLLLPGFVRMRESMVSRLRPCMTTSTPLPSRPPFPSGPPFPSPNHLRAAPPAPPTCCHWRYFPEENIRELSFLPRPLSKSAPALHHARMMPPPHPLPPPPPRASAPTLAPAPVLAHVSYPPPFPPPPPPRPLPHTVYPLRHLYRA